MKTLKIVALFVGFSVAGTLPAVTTRSVADFVFRVKSFTEPKSLVVDAEDTELTQADFMTVAVLASLASNTMISKNNSAFRAALCSFAALHGSYYFTQLWGNKANRLCSAATTGAVGAATGAIQAFGWQVPQVNLDPVKVNQLFAIIIYLLGQNAPQFLDLLKEYWKGGLLNPMPFIRIFTKNRDQSELVAIAVRNALPLVLYSKQGADMYSWAKSSVKPHLAYFHTDAQ